MLLLISGTSACKIEDGQYHCLIMDEVDGMAGNEDRGGIQVMCITFNFPNIKPEWFKLVAYTLTKHNGSVCDPVRHDLINNSSVQMVCVSK